jgi:hypothetical protein
MVGLTADQPRCLDPCPPEPAASMCFLAGGRPSTSPAKRDTLPMTANRACPTVTQVSNFHLPSHHLLHSPGHMVAEHRVISINVSNER